MTIGKRMAVTFGAVVALVLGTGIYAVVQLAAIGEQATDLYEHPFKVTKEIQELAVLLAENKSNVLQALMSNGGAGFEAAVARVDANKHPMLVALESVRQRYLGPRADLEAFDHEYLALKGIREELIGLVRAGKGPAASELYRSKYEQQQGRVDATLEPIVKFAAAKAETFARMSAEASQRAIRLVAWLEVALLLLTVVLGVYLTRRITRAVGLLADGARKLAAGGLDHRVEAVGSDEFAQLAGSFNQMAAALQKSMLEEKEARGRTEKLLATVAVTAESLAAGTSEILAATTQQASGAQEQAAAVSETVTTVDEITQTADQAALRAKDVASVSIRSVETGRAGRLAVEESMAGMGSVKEQVESIAESILALAEQAQAIGEIIASVNDIAEQTNLLALNAGIEASRAGEHGRGFQVVAAEVKALADQAKKATAQVRQILGDIQKATNGAVMATEEGQKSVKATLKLVGQAGDTIKSLAETISEAAQAAAQIAASAGQQATGITQIHQAMKNINTVTNQNLASTRRQEKAAQELNGLGEKLREQLRARGA